MAAQQRVSLATHQSMVGSEVDVLIEGPSRRDREKWAGRDPAHRIVVLDDKRLKEGMIVRAEVTDVTALTLFGRIVSLNDQAV